MDGEPLRITLETSKFISEIIKQWLEKREQKKKDLKVQINLTLDTMETLIQRHIEEIQNTVYPIIKDQENGLQISSEKFRTLIYGTNFPWGYNEVARYLEHFRDEKPFKEGTKARLQLESVLSEFKRFQYSVFPLMYESGKFADVGFGGAIELWKKLTDNNFPTSVSKEELQQSVHRNFSDAFKWLEKEREWLSSHGKKSASPIVSNEEIEKLTDVSQLNKPEGVVNLVKKWCMAWHNHVLQQTWGDSLKKSIVQLRVLKI